MKTIKMKIKAKDKRNELHFEVQTRTRAQIFQDRRFKKPKHKNEEEF